MAGASPDDFFVTVRLAVPERPGHATSRTRMASPLVDLEAESAEGAVEVSEHILIGFNDPEGAILDGYVARHLAEDDAVPLTIGFGLPESLLDSGKFRLEPGNFLLERAHCLWQ